MTVRDKSGVLNRMFNVCRISLNFLLEFGSEVFHGMFLIDLQKCESEASELTEHFKQGKRELITFVGQLLV